MTDRPFARLAREFLVWRAATAVGWDCTPQDVAAQLGVSDVYVRKVCARRGWQLLGDRNTGRDASEATPVDQLMSGRCLRGAV